MPRIAIVIASLSAALLVALAASPARAGLALGVDLDVAVPVGPEGNGRSAGRGMEGRVGYALDIGPLELTAELRGTYARFPTANGDGDLHIVHARAGGRIGFGALFVPSAYLHGGYGFTVNGGADLIGGSGVLGGGVALDVRLIPLLGFGVHAGFDTLAQDDEVADGLSRWVNLGVHAGARF